MAEAQARQQGGYLATITSLAEYEWIKREVIEKATHSDTEGGPWIGARQDARTHEWEWVTGEKWTYAPWGPHEPNSGGTQPFAHLWVWKSPWLNDSENEGHKNVFTYLIEFERVSNKQTGSTEIPPKTHVEPKAASASAPLPAFSETLSSNSRALLERCLEDMIRLDDGTIVSIWRINRIRCQQKPGLSVTEKNGCRAPEAVCRGRPPFFEVVGGEGDIAQNWRFISACHERSESAISVQQTLEGGARVRGNFGHPYEQDVMVHGDVPNDLHDGSRIAGEFIAIPGEPFAYTTVMGAARTIPSFELRHLDYPHPSLDELGELILSGRWTPSRWVVTSTAGGMTWRANGSTTDPIYEGSTYSFKRELIKVSYKRGRKEN